jgi:hypothetical protein
LSAGGLGGFNTLKISNGTSVTTIAGALNVSTSVGDSFRFTNGLIGNGGVWAPTTGESNLMIMWAQSGPSTTFQPTSGTAIVNTLKFTPTISQSGTANGITRGIYMVPTLELPDSPSVATCVVTAAGTSGSIIVPQVTISGVTTSIGGSGYVVLGGDTAINVATGIVASINASTSGYTATNIGGTSATMTITAPAGTGTLAGDSGYLASFSITGSSTVSVTSQFRGGQNLGTAVNWRTIEDASTTGYSYYQSSASAKNYLNGTTTIGTTSGAAGAKLTVSGGVATNHLIGSGSSPSISIFGSTPVQVSSVSISGDDIGGIITMTTSSNTMGAHTGLVQVTFAASFASAPKCIILSPAEVNSAIAFASGAMPYIDSTGAIASSSFQIYQGQNTLAQSTTYKYYYFIKQ